jgi:hypothetical protein
MGEEVYFFKLDKQKAREELTKKITAAGDFSYHNYLREEYGGNHNQMVYDEICYRIHQDIELLSEDELFSLFFWFEDNNYRKNKDLGWKEQAQIVYDEMLACGMDFFYEIPSKTPVRNFHSVMVDFGFIADQDFGYKAEARQYMDFLDYLLCYTGELKLLLNKYYYKDYEEYSEEIRVIMNYIKANAKHDYHKHALAEFEQEEAYHLETLSLTPKLSQFRKERMNESYTLPEELVETYHRESELLNKAHVWDIGFMLKEKLEGYEGSVFKLHSY